MPFDWSPLWLSVRYAGLATLFAMALGLPLAWLLARRRFPGSNLLDAAATLPIVLPPAVLAYYLLVTLGRWQSEFSWRTALVLSTIYTLPLLVAIFRAGLEAVDRSFENAARSLGASEWRVFWRVSAPLAWRPLIAAMLAGFARAFADFGLTATIAGTERSGWTTFLIIVIALVSLGALYTGSRLSRSRVPA